MWSSRFALPVQTDFGELFALLLGSILDLFLFAVLFLFGLFHLYLLAKGMTTIEFCEKRLRRTDAQPPAVRTPQNCLTCTDTYSVHACIYFPL